MDQQSAVEDLCILLEQYVGLKDRQAIEIILSTRVDPYPWIALETDAWEAEEWITLGRPVKTFHLQHFQRARFRQGIEWIDPILKHQGPQLFIDPNWRKPPFRAVEKIAYQYLNDRLLRLRVEYPRGPELGPRENSEIFGAGVRCLNLAEGNMVPQWRVTEDILDALRCLQRINPELRDWNELRKNIRKAVQAHAVLFGHTVIEESDASVAWRLMHDGIRYWQLKILEDLLRVKHNLTQVSNSTGIGLDIVKSELQRMLRDKVVRRWDYQYRIADERVKTLVWTGVPETTGQAYPTLAAQPRT